MEIRIVVGPIRQNEFGLESMQMRLVSWRNLQGGRLDLDETFDVEPTPHQGRNPPTSDQPGAPLAVSPNAPKGLRRRRAQGTLREKLDTMEINSDWPLALKSVWFLP
jgi:hypothetical protein